MKTVRVAGETARAMHRTGSPNPGLGLAQHSREVNSPRAERVSFPVFDVGKGKTNEGSLVWGRHE